MTDLWLFEDISGNGVEVSQVFDGGDVLWDGFDHHLTGRQHQLMGSHLTAREQRLSCTYIELRGQRHCETAAWQTDRLIF